LKISQREDVELSLSDDTFKDMYVRTFKESIYKLCRKFKPNKLILAMDCPRCNIWRTEIMPTYKDRKKLADFDEKTFPLIINEVVPLLKRELMDFKFRRKVIPIEVHSIQHERAEADDLVYIYTRRAHSEEEKIIITGDNDYLQLLDDKTEIYDLKLKPLRDKSLGSNDKDILLKVLGGDPSDNIAKLMTKKKAIDYINETSVEEIYRTYESNDKFKNNMKMVNMNNIPEDIIDEVKTMLCARNI
jgi:5'-3' exonuclease